MKLNFLAGLFSALAIFILGMLSEFTGEVFLIAPFGASCIVLFGFPEGPFARLRNVIGGYLISTLIGLLFSLLPFNPTFLMAMAVGISVFLMFVTGTTHPAAASVPIVIFLSKASPSFLLFPISSSLLILIVLSFFHRALSKWLPDYNNQ